MFNIAWILSGFASNPLCETIKSRNFLNATPKAHLLRFSFILSSKHIKSYLEVVQMLCLPGFLNKHVVHVHFNVSPNLWMKHMVD